MVSNTAVVIFIQRYYMCAFTANLSPNIVNEGKNWFCLIPLVLVLRTSNPFRYDSVVLGSTPKLRIVQNAVVL